MKHVFSTNRFNFAPIFGGGGILYSLIFCVFLLSFSVSFAQPYEACWNDEEVGCDANWTTEAKFFPVNDYDTCRILVSYRYKKCDPPCSLIVIIDTVGIPHNDKCSQMLLERYYAGPLPYTNPDWNYLREIWDDASEKVFRELVNTKLATCSDTVECPDPTPRSHIIAVKSACMRWCTAKTSFTAPPNWVLQAGGSLATIQQISKCYDICCVTEIKYYRDANCNYIEYSRSTRLRDENGDKIPINSFICNDKRPSACFWENNSWYMQGTNSDCLTNCTIEN